MGNRRAVAILFFISLVVRLVYVSMASVVFGDAVNYSFVAQSLFSKSGVTADYFWLNSFCYWQALVSLLGFSPHATAIISSCIPGMFLFVPVYLLITRMYGSWVGFFSGLFIAIHPRFVEYSLNGYAETWYLFWLALSLLCVDMKYLVFAGISLGVVATQRNEYVLFFGLLCILFFVILEYRPFLKRFIGGFLALIACYIALSFATTHTMGIFQKVTVTSKKYSEQLDMRASAKEVYGAKGQEESKGDSFLDRFKKNCVYSFTKLPTVLLLPLFLFVWVPFTSRCFSSREWPLACLAVFSLVFYQFFQVEPRYFFGALIPLTAWSVLGVSIVCKKWPKVAFPLLFVLITSALGLSIWRARCVERQYRYHSEVAAWLSRNVSKGEPIVGCGYGYASTTGFILNRQVIRRCWATSEQELYSYMKQHNAHWLLLYEEYVEKADKELLPLFDNTTYFLKQYETKDSNNKRIILLSS